LAFGQVGEKNYGKDCKENQKKLTQNTTIWSLEREGDHKTLFGINLKK